MEPLHQDLAIAWQQSSETANSSVTKVNWWEQVGGVKSSLLLWQQQSETSPNKPKACKSKQTFHFNASGLTYRRWTVGCSLRTLLMCSLLAEACVLEVELAEYPP